MATKGKSAKKKPTLQVRDCPPDLLALINGTAGLLDIDRNEFVVKILRKELTPVEPLRDQAKAWWEQRNK